MSYPDTPRSCVLPLTTSRADQTLPLFLRSKVAAAMVERAAKKISAQ